jgi:hypothetical protein
VRAWPSVLTALAVLLPVVLTDRTFGGDWPLHLWLVELQRRAIEDGGAPTLVGSFSPVGHLYPTGAFLGGTVYAVVAYSAALLGSAEAGLVLLHVMAIGGALIGWHALAVVCGLRGSLAHVPGAIHLTGAYVVGDLLGRGGVSSVVGVAMLPLVAGAAARVLTASGPARGWTVVLAGAVCILVAAHNVTLLWVVTFALVLVPVLLVALLPTLRDAGRAVVRIVLAVAGGVLLTMWQMLPNLAYAPDTVQARRGAFVGEWGEWFSRPSVWLHPLRVLPEEHLVSSLYVQLPVFAMAWLVLCAGVVVRSTSPARRLAAAGLTACLGLALVAVSVRSLYDVLPDVYRATQFTMRVNHFVLLAVAGLVLVTLTALGERTGPARARAAGAVLVVVAVGVAITAWQSWATRENVDEPRAALVAGDDVSRYWYDPVSFADTSLPLWTRPPPPGPRSESLAGETLTVRTTGELLRRGVLVRLQGTPRLLEFRGAEPVARIEGAGVVLMSFAARPGAATVTVGVRSGGAAAAGRLLTVLGAFVVLLAVLLPARPPGRPGAAV